MNRKLITAVLCVLVIVVAVISVVLFANSMKDNEPDNNIESNQQTTDDTQPPTTDKTKPEGTTDVQQEKPTIDDTEQEQTDTSGESEQQPDTGDKEEQPSVQPTVKTELGTDYKTFSLTKDMTALEAYEYLNEFLNSKYSILVNKQNKVGSDYEPSDLIVPSGCDYKMERVAADALVDMLSAAKSDGIYDLVLYSGYRTYSSQKNKYETRTQKYLDQGYSQADAEAKAGEYIAPPGASEHHTGLAADVCSYKIVSKYGYLSDDFDTTEEFKWLKEHCAEYGFILRYTKEDEAITGYLYEPWHYRYIGVEHATACMDAGLTYEEYYQTLVKYRDEAKADAGV